MKATVDVPDVLYRRVKARAAMEGRAVRDVTIELYEHWLGDRNQGDGTSQDAADAWLARWRDLGDAIGHAAVDPRATAQIVIDDRR